MIARRAFLRGLLATPAVVAAGSLMPVRSIERFLTPALLVPDYQWVEWKIVNTEWHSVYRVGDAIRVIDAPPLIAAGEWVIR